MKVAKSPQNLTVNGAKLFLTKEEFPEWEQPLSQPQILDSVFSNKVTSRKWLSDLENHGIQSPGPGMSMHACVRARTHT